MLNTLNLPTTTKEATADCRIIECTQEDHGHTTQMANRLTARAPTLTLELDLLSVFCMILIALSYLFFYFIIFFTDVRVTATFRLHSSVIMLCVHQFLPQYFDGES